MDSIEDVLKQLDDIHSSLVESERFMPYNYNVVIMWGVSSIIMILFTQTIFEMSILYGVIFLIFILGIGWIAEYIMTKQENQKYDIDRYTKIQKFTESIFTFSVIFGILISLLLAKNMLISYIYLVWVFLLSLSGYLAGFVVNSKLFLRHSQYSMSISFILFILTLFFDIAIFNQIFALLSIGVGYIFIGIKLKK
jgi:hypothetical protein